MEKEKSVKKSSLRFIFTFITLLLNCCILTGCFDQSEQFTKIVHMPVESLSPGSGFSTITHNGSIEVRGSDGTDCNVTATIVGRAATIEAAEKVVERTELGFEHSDEKLVLDIKRPQNLIDCSVSVSLDVIIPENINLELESHNGRIEIDNIIGRTIATTHNGRISVDNLQGIISLESHNGRVEGDEISGDINFKTHNGRINASFSPDADPGCNITLISHNGSIELTTPPNYSAQVDISTHNGSIDTDLPVTVSGQLSKNKLTGTIGSGQGQMNVETYNGSIRIR